MVRLHVIAEDRRDARERGEALARARESRAARACLSAVLEDLHQAQAAWDARASAQAAWDALERAYAGLDRYLAALSTAAAIRPRCGPGCSTCCTDAPPILGVEALRMARALGARPDGPARLARAAAQAEELRELLRRRGLEPEPSIEDPRYREAQLEWRARGHRCPILGDDGECSAYAARPLACRVHVHVHDPAWCDPQHPQFAAAERPRLWGHPREAEVELALMRISEALGLARTTNLQLGLAALD